ncbi:hypothetical protein MKZ38_008035 [Zalerion maritima]|uniref:WSC domain-containing protein n=1 Tax=Zalerion maritima TaxID=339359 RepID=A0AAD5RLF1_9PEZI|nr:hypothetical protein MKZ38_008035 [Zalerion maritima]
MPPSFVIRRLVTQNAVTQEAPNPDPGNWVVPKITALSRWGVLPSAARSTGGSAGRTVQLRVKSDCVPPACFQHGPFVALCHEEESLRSPTTYPSRPLKKVCHASVWSLLRGSVLPALLTNAYPVTSARKYPNPFETTTVTIARSSALEPTGAPHPFFPIKDGPVIYGGGSGYSFRGCYAMPSQGGRSLGGYVLPSSIDQTNLTAEECLSQCSRLISRRLPRPYEYTAMEMGRDCICGTTLLTKTEKVEESECASSCPGDSDIACGGNQHALVYASDRRRQSSLDPPHGMASAAFTAMVDGTSIETSISPARPTDANKPPSMTDNPNQALNQPGTVVGLTVFLGLLLAAIIVAFSIYKRRRNSSPSRKDLREISQSVPLRNPFAVKTASSSGPEMIKNDADIIYGARPAEQGMGITDVATACSSNRRPSSIYIGSHTSAIGIPEARTPLSPRKPVQWSRFDPVINELQISRPFGPSSYTPQRPQSTIYSLETNGEDNTQSRGFRARVNRDSGFSKVSRQSSNTALSEIIGTTVMTALNVDQIEREMARGTKSRDAKSVRDMNSTSKRLSEASKMSNKSDGPPSISLSPLPLSTFRISLNPHTWPTSRPASQGYSVSSDPEIMRQGPSSHVAAAAASKPRDLVIPPSFVEEEDLRSASSGRTIISFFSSPHSSPFSAVGDSYILISDFHLPSGASPSMPERRHNRRYSEPFLPSGSPAEGRRQGVCNSVRVAPRCDSDFTNSRIPEDNGGVLSPGSEISRCSREVGFLLQRSCQDSDFHSAALKSKQSRWSWDSDDLDMNKIPGTASPIPTVASHNPAGRDSRQLDSPDSRSPTSPQNATRSLQGKRFSLPGTLPPLRPGSIRASLLPAPLILSSPDSSAVSPTPSSAIEIIEQPPTGGASPTSPTPRPRPRDWFPPIAPIFTSPRPAPKPTNSDPYRRSGSLVPRMLENGLLHPRPPSLSIVAPRPKKKSSLVPRLLVPHRGFRFSSLDNGPSGTWTIPDGEVSGGGGGGGRWSTSPIYTRWEVGLWPAPEDIGRENQNVVERKVPPTRLHHDQHQASSARNITISSAKQASAVCKPHIYSYQVRGPEAGKMTTTFINGKIYTAKDIRQEEATFSSCLSIRDGRVVYVGSNPDPTAAASDPAAIREATENAEKVIDLAGRTVLPGFIDAHVHLMQLGQALQKLDLTPCNSLSDIREAIKEYAEENPRKERILCRCWMHSMTDGEADKSMLDDLDPRPIYIDSKDLHSAWCSSAALAEMGIADLETPEGGVIRRDPAGSPTGLLEETACVSIVWPYLARQAKDIERLGGLLSAIRSMSAYGYTGAVDMAMDEEAWESLLAMRSQFKSPLPLRIAAHWFVHPKGTEEENMRQVERAIELNKEFHDKTSPDLRVVGVKMMCDGVVDACTAHLVDPYSHDNSHPAPLWDPEALEKVVRKADENGLQCALHAIGDGAVKLAIDSLEKGATGTGKRHRIEHLEMTRPGDAKRLADLGITASINPVHADPAILKAWPKLIGDRCGRAFAYKEYLDAGANVALGTDAPTAPYAATGNMYVASTRRSGRQPEALDTFNEHYKLSLCQSVATATAGSAYSCFDEGRVGRLEPGMKADFAILDMAWEADKLLDAKVTETWFNGKKVFQAD